MIEIKLNGYSIPTNEEFEKAHKDLDAIKKEYEAFTLDLLVQSLTEEIRRLENMTTGEFRK